MVAFKVYQGRGFFLFLKKSCTGNQTVRWDLLVGSLGGRRVSKTPGLHGCSLRPMVQVRDSSSFPSRAIP